MVVLREILNTVFDWELIQTGFHADGRLQEILNTVCDWELIQTGFHKGGRLQEILNSVFDWELIQTGISERWSLTSDSEYCVWLRTDSNGMS